MNILFPASPINPRQIDDAFADEARAAKEAGFGISRVDLEVILGGEVRLSGIPDERADFAGRGDILYRGWLMKPEQYTAVDIGLGRDRLITGPSAYDTAYHLPKWYPLFAESVTPRTLILPGQTFDLDEVASQVYRALGHSFTDAQSKEIDDIHAWQNEHGTMIIHNRTDLLELPTTHPVMVKDYLKSAKHRWYDACFMPDCSDRENVKRVTKNFLACQGDNLTGGLCFRKFIAGKQIGVHSKTSQPLVNEWRAFLRFGKVFYLCPYWAEGDYDKGAKPYPDMVETLCMGLKDLPFVAVDLGQREFVNRDFVPVGDALGHFPTEWVVYEINDGGAAGVPDGGDVSAFYRALAKEYAQ